MSKDTLNKDLDKTSTAGAMAVYKNDKERREVAAALQADKELAGNVMDYIFGGAEVTVNPLAEIRKK